MAGWQYWTEPFRVLAFPRSAVPEVRLSHKVTSAAGAGDGILAGMALAYSRGEPLENGLRYGFALAGAVLQTLATADFRLSDYHALLPRIQFIPII